MFEPMDKSVQVVVFALVSVIMTGLTLMVDLSTPHGPAVWLLYLVQLLLSTYVFGRRGVFLVSLSLMLCVATGYVFSDDSAHSSIALLNRALIICTLLIAAHVMTSRLKAFAELERTKEDLERLTASLKAANQELTREVERRKALEREKSEFLAMISHDMKSPLSVISGYADLLMNSKFETLDADARSMVEGYGLIEQAAAEAGGGFCVGDKDRGGKAPATAFFPEGRGRAQGHGRGILR
jgi:signal transduction histidine kinase